VEPTAPTVTDKSNPAYRVLSLLTAAKQQPDDIPAIAAWANTLGVSKADLLDDRFHTVEMLHLLTRQITLAKNQMHLIGQFSEDTYAFAFDHAQQTINVAGLSAHWNSYKQYITPEVLTTLKWCSQATPADPIQVQDEELDTLEQELAEFKSRVEKQTTNEELRSFVLEHIALIEKAFLEYRIVGVRAFQRAAGELLTSLEDPHNQDVFERNRDKPEVQQVVSIWHRLFQAGQIASTLNSAVNLVQKALEVGGDFIS
jgi:hypothetical protein